MKRHLSNYKNVKFKLRKIILGLKLIWIRTVLFNRNEKKLIV
jgi:hypothetical protein